jgi:hypothetical protein
MALMSALQQLLLQMVLGLAQAQILQVKMGHKEL